MGENKKRSDSPWLVFLVFLKLGLSSFGGPIAHIAYFREEFVNRKKWLSDQRYTDLVALCQFLPGPASSQIGLAIGMQRSGYAGALAAWLGFTLPSATLLIVLALGLADYNSLMTSGAVNGLKVVAVAIVAQAVWGMSNSLCPDILRRGLMLLAAALVILVPSILTQIGVIVMGGFIGLLFFKKKFIVTLKQEVNIEDDTDEKFNRRAGLLCLVIFATCLISLPLLSKFTNNVTIDVIDAFFRSGSMVFGGGHVVLPLLQAETVSTGWISNDSFLAGYGATQAVPGPLFTFAAFIGSTMTGISGGLICLIAIFLPSFLLIIGVLPFWETLRRNTSIKATLSGINSCVVGILLAALYTPLWSTAIQQWQDLVMVLVSLLALMKFKLSPWIVVLGCATLGWLSQAFF